MSHSLSKVKNSRERCTELGDGTSSGIHRYRALMVDDALISWTLSSVDRLTTFPIRNIKLDISKLVDFFWLKSQRIYVDM